MSTLHELLSRDPNECSKQDIDAIIEYYRSKRKQFDMGDLKAGAAKKQSKGEAEAAAITKNLNVGDLL